MCVTGGGCDGSWASLSCFSLGCVSLVCTFRCLFVGVSRECRSGVHGIDLIEIPNDKHQ